MEVDKLFKTFSCLNELKGLRIFHTFGFEISIPEKFVGRTVHVVALMRVWDLLDHCVSCRKWIA